MTARVTVLVLSLLWALPARAQETAGAAGRTASLGWARLPGAEACPSTQAIAQATEALLGRAAFVSPAEAALAIEGRVEPQGAGFRATLVVSDAAGVAIGTRVVETEGACDALLGPLSIALAVLVDPDAETTTPTPDPDPAPTPTPPPEPRVVTQVVTERVEVPGPRWRLEIDLGAVLSLGATAFVSGGGELYVFLTPPGFVPIGLHGWVVPFSRAERPMGAYVDQLTSWAGLSICPIAGRDDTFSLAACAGLDVGGVFVLGQSQITPTERERITGGLDVSVRGRVRLIGPLWAVLSLALLVPFRQEGFFGTDGARYYGPEPVALIVTLGPSFAFEP
ncbi:MAG: hypothetical protein U0234_29810 [Sandaracinus sp.]